MTPHLCTDKESKSPVDLIQFTKEDIHEDYIAWLNDPIVTRHSRQRKLAHTQASCEAFVDSFDGLADHVWMIIARGTHIGNITYRSYDSTHGDLAIMVGRKEYWNQGYGTEAFRLAYRWLVERGIRPIVGSTNPAMHKVMRKLGIEEV